MVAAGTVCDGLVLAWQYLTGGYSGGGASKNENASTRIKSKVSKSQKSITKARSYVLQQVTALGEPILCGCVCSSFGASVLR